VRFQIIQLVLATDLACTFEYTSKFQSLLRQESDFEKPSEVLLLMQIMIKCADVSHATRILPLHKKWTTLIKREFHNQGDLERKENMPISPLCDRHACFLPREQQGFIDYVVVPIFRPFSLYVGSKTYLKNCAENYKYWHFDAQEKAPGRRMTKLVMEKGESFLRIASGELEQLSLRKKDSTPSGHDGDSSSTESDDDASHVGLHGPELSPTNAKEACVSNVTPVDRCEV